MFECIECGAQFDEESNLIEECPLCGEYFEDILQCPYCETIYTLSGDIWECPNCDNEGISVENSIDYRECPSCGALIDGCYCEECGWPDVNQGWLGENYG